MPRLPVCLLALLLSSVVMGAAPPPVNERVVLTADAEQRWIAFTLTPGNQLRFTAMLDGEPVGAILDTGASRTMLSRAYAERTGRAVTPRGRVAAIGGAVAGGWTAIGRLTLGGLERTGGGLSVIDLPASATGAAQAVDLLVGSDLTRNYALDIDYAGRRFRILPTGRLPFVGARMSLRMGSEPLAYITDLVVAGQRLRPIIVDTGDGTSLTLARSTWRTLPLDPAPAMTTQLSYGVGGAVVADVATLPQVTLGNATIRDVGVWIERSGGFSDAARSAGRIGMGLLQRYRVLLDPAAGIMVLGPATTPAPPVSTSGLQLSLTGNHLRIMHVMRNSPAEALGLRVGTTICRVDDVAIGTDPVAATRADWPYGRPGTSVALEQCDGRRVTLTLRRFY